jgi:undecaprenyl-diphosphatase
MDSSVARRNAMILPRLAALLMVCLVALLAGLLWWPWVASADAAINRFFGPYRVQPLLDGFIWLTAFGANPTIVAVCVTTTGLLGVARLPALIPPLWIAFLGAATTSWSLKHLVARARPEFLEVASATSPSFPSGHSISSMAVYGFVAFVLTSHGPGGRLAAVLPVILGVLIVLVGFSRIFLSVHYTSDVLAGFLGGAFWLVVAILLARQISR